MQKDIKNLLDISERIGKNSKFIALSGGNISLKIDNKILIKGSGQMLSKAKTKPIFVELDSNGKKDKLNINNLKDLSKVVNPDIKPSIELSLHINLPYKFIIHSHPINVIALTIMEVVPESIKKNIEKYSYIKLPYIEIGKNLGNIIQKYFLKTKANIFILGNHGIVVGHDNPLEAEKLHYEFCEKININRRLPPRFNRSLIIPFVNIIPNAFISDLDIIHSLATDPVSLKLCKMNAPYPDQIVFCGEKPLIVKSKDELKGISLVNKKWILIENIGVLILDHKIKEIQEMLSTLAEIYLHVNNLKNINLLSDSESRNISIKQEEKYRIDMLGK